jgi:hypothetical protein
MAKAFSSLRGPKLGLDDQITFGKYQGSTVLELCRDCPSYISWIMQNTDIKFYESVTQELSRHLTKHVARHVSIGAWRYPDYDHDTCNEWSDWDADVPF